MNRMGLEGENFLDLLFFFFWHPGKILYSFKFLVLIYPLGNYGEEERDRKLEVKSEICLLHIIITLSLLSFNYILIFYEIISAVKTLTGTAICSE